MAQAYEARQAFDRYGMGFVNDQYYLTPTFVLGEQGAMQRM